VRDFLTRNKIFFEIFASCLLGIMAVSVSINANKIAQAQLVLAREAQKIAAIPYVPHMRVRIKNLHSRDPLQKPELVVINDGDSAREFSSSTIAFLQIQEMRRISLQNAESENKHLNKASIALEDYLPDYIYTAEKDKGEMFSQLIEKSELMPWRMEEFYDALSAGDKSFSLGVDMYLVVKYKDQFENLHSDYYGFNFLGEGVLMDPERGRLLFLEYETARRAHQIVNFFNSTPADVVMFWARFAR
jgi:hypothetical protein